MDEAEVARHVDNPEFLVAGRGIDNLLRSWQFDQRRVLDLGMDANDVVCVVKNCPALESALSAI